MKRLKRRRRKLAFILRQRPDFVIHAILLSLTAFFFYLDSCGSKPEPIFSRTRWTHNPQGTSR